VVSRSLQAGAVADLVARVEVATAAHQARYPGDPGGRQPVSTVYVPADRFTAATAQDFGREALRLLDAHAPDGPALAEAFDLRGDLAGRVRERVAAKLGSEPVEDLRVDFEDGYGLRVDDEEDTHAAAAAAAVAVAVAEGTLPPFAGLRVKPFCDGLHRRSIRTLDVFLTTLLDATGGTLPAGFVVTFPKVVAVEHVAAFVSLLERLEGSLSLPAGALRFELQVETTQSVVDDHGRLALRRFLDVAGGRLSGAHFGVFDYTAACGLPPAEQRLDHPACDFARHVMQVALAGTVVRLSDGSTNVVPDGDGTAAVRRAWRVHAGQVRHSLRHGYVQGWDLHPAHLPSRYAVVFAFLLDDLDGTSARVRAWTEQGGGDGGVLDEPATVKALVAHLRRAVDAGAVKEADVLAATGLAPGALHPAG
jgi:citrate lyase beta subunit